MTTEQLAGPCHKNLDAQLPTGSSVTTTGWPTRNRPGNGYNFYRLLMILIVISIYTFRVVVIRSTPLRIRPALGYIATLGYFLGLLEFSTLVLLRGIRKLSRYLGFDRLFGMVVVILATAFMIGVFFSSHYSGYPSMRTHAPPWIGRIAVLAIWVGFATYLVTHPSIRTFVIGFAGLVLATRWHVYASIPFSELVREYGADMLPNIDRSLGYLFAGEFPYVDRPPPPMPYFPLMFLPYAPAKLLGLDLRLVNLFFELATVALVMLWPPIGSSRSIQVESGRTLCVAAVALPLLMLHPLWTFFAATTQFPPSIFLVVLFAKSMLIDQPYVQAIALATAVGGNPTTAIFGFPLAAYWLRRYGVRTALLSGATSFLSFFLILSPFLVWNAKKFVWVTAFSLDPFTSEHLAGRFTLVPLISIMGPTAVPMAIVVIVSIGSLLAYRTTRPESVAIIIGLSYCLTLFFFPRNMSWYFLPSIAMIAACPIGRRPVEDSGVGN